MMNREEIARIEIGHTTVSRRVALAIVGWFLLMLAVLPLTEMLGGRRADDAPSPWSQLAGIGEAIDERLAGIRAQSQAPGSWTTLVTANRAVLEGLNGFETAIEDQSVVGRALRPRTQRLLSGVLGAGNERVYVGRDGWLFYRPDVEYVTGGGFLEPREIKHRGASASEYENPPQPDPRPAIRQFKRDLDARGITLIVMPTPVKPTIHAGELALAHHTSEPVPNASYQAFVDEMRREGLLVFDPSAEIARAREAGAPQYLATDTHWRPETMQRVAEALVVFLDQHTRLQPVASPGYSSQRREAQQIGDTTAMLDLPSNQTLYPPERVTLRFITDAVGEPWRPSRDADILLLGDSFTNMFSLTTMGWGEAAGFAEQLSYTLQRPVDRIVQNDQGAHATRGLLRRDVGGPGDRLAGKRVVIWQFAARELAFGDWRVIEIPPSPQ